MLTLRRTLVFTLTLLMAVPGGMISSAWATPAEESGSSATQDDSTTATAATAVEPQTSAVKLRDALIERGLRKEQAQAVVDSLTPEDTEVLAENPEMLQAAGDESDAVFAALLVLLLVLLLAAAASAG